MANTIGAVLTDIGLTNQRRDFFIGDYPNDPVDFAKLWDWGSGYRALGNLEGVEFETGAGAARVTRKFRSTPNERDAFQGFALWLHTTIAQGQTPNVQTYLANANIQLRWIKRAQVIYRTSKSKTDSGSRLEDDLVVIQQGALKNIGMWEKVKQLISHGLRQLSSDNDVGNLRYLTRPDMTNWVAGDPADINAVEFGGDFDKLAYATLSIHYPRLGVSIPDTAPMHEQNRLRVELDGQRLWEIIAKVTDEQPTFELVRKFQASRDGIGAYRRLVEEAEGSTSTASKRSKAYKGLRDTVFTGRSPRFTWSAFIAKQEGHFAALDEAGEPCAETRKVNELLSHITDPRLESAKDHVYGDRAMLENYNMASQYLGTCLANRATSQGYGTGRHVGLTDSERKDKEEREAAATEQKTPSGIEWKSGRYLPKAEYAKLHTWEREAHKKVVASLKPEKKKTGRNRSKRKGSPGGDAGKDPKERKVSTVETGTESDAKAGTTGTKTVPTTTSAGNQFGRNSHAKKKKGVSFEEEVTEKVGKMTMADGSVSVD